MIRSSLLILACLGLGLASLGCEDHHDWDDEGGRWIDSPPPPPPGGGSTNPILAVVDTDRTLNSPAGQGVGIYTEYASGGHWHVWWTCDTNISGLPCSIVVSARAESGTVSNVEGDQLLGSDSVTSTQTTVSATANTSTNTAGVFFDTDPGIIIELTASVDGVADPRYLFFAQDGQTNGGYSGQLTDPLRLEPSKP